MEEILWETGRTKARGKGLVHYIYSQLIIIIIIRKKLLKNTFSSIKGISTKSLLPRGFILNCLI